MRLSSSSNVNILEWLVSMPVVRLFVGSALTISFGSACRGYTLKTASMPAAWDVPLVWGRTSKRCQCQQRGMCHQCGAELQNGVSASSMGCATIVGQNLKTASVPSAWDVPPVWGRTEKRCQRGMCHQCGAEHKNGVSASLF